MLDFVIFASTFVTVLIITVFYLYPGTRKTGTTIPGLDPSDRKEGNISDIQQKGSLHEFLTDLHENYGPIASFWLETQLVVSLASPKLFKEHDHVFNRSGDLFAVFKPLLGKEGIFFQNGTTARKNHSTFTRILYEESKCRNAGFIFSEMSKEMVLKLESLPRDQHVPLNGYLTALAAKSILVALFGSFFRKTENVLSFRRNYEICISDIEQKLKGQRSEDDKTTKENVENAIKALRNQIKVLIDERKKVSQSNETSLFVDELLKSHNEVGEIEGLVDTILTFMHFGFQTTANLLTWVFYHLAVDRDIQNKVFNELSRKDTKGEQDIKLLRYTRQVIDETLRLDCIVPFTTRSQEIDVEIGGHRVPKGTPIVHAIGVVQNDPEIWTSPEKFDPERFSNEIETSLPNSCPFGFAGKRKCPGEEFVQTLVTVVLIEVLQELEVKLVEDQVVLPNYCVFTRPDDEIWIKINKRSDQI